MGVLFQQGDLRINGINFTRDSIELEFKVFFNASEDRTTVKNEDILTWYKERHLKLSIMSHLATIIFSIALSQA